MKYFFRMKYISEFNISFLKEFTINSLINLLNFGLLKLLYLFNSIYVGIYINLIIFYIIKII